MILTDVEKCTVNHRIVKQRKYETMKEQTESYKSCFCMMMDSTITFSLSVRVI